MLTDSRANNCLRLRSAVRSRRAARSLKIEALDTRLFLAADVGFDIFGAAVAAAEQAAADPTTAQYFVKHPPRLQPGNAPLIGTPAFDGFDQVDVIWQTESAGDGDQDSFVTEFRRVGEVSWQPAVDNGSFETKAGTKVMHSASIFGLEWATEYEYRVQHLQAGEIVETYQHQFTTRLPAGDPRPFSFAAYGDSAVRGRIADFNSVQSRINEMDPEFAVLLGDNFYTFGTHQDADGRFDPHYSPEAVDWTARKIDYFSVGNHDIFIENGQVSRDLYSVPHSQGGREFSGATSRW